MVVPLAPPRGRPPGRLHLGIIAVLAREGPLPAGALARRLGAPTRRVSYTLQYLKRKGLVERSGAAWRLTPEGRAAAELLERHGFSRAQAPAGPDPR